MSGAVALNLEQIETLGAATGPESRALVAEVRRLQAENEQLRHENAELRTINDVQHEGTQKAIASARFHLAEFERLRVLMQNVEDVRLLQIADNTRAERDEARAALAADEEATK